MKQSGFLLKLGTMLLLFLLGFMISCTESTPPKASQAISQFENSTDGDPEVLICKSSGAEVYHDHECWGLRKCKHMVGTVSVSEAQGMGRRPCEICY